MTEIIAAIMAFMVAITSPRNPDERIIYAQAIAEATSDHEEQRALTTIAKSENWFHRTSYPPFGLTDYVNTHHNVCLFNALDPRTRDPRLERRNCTHLSVQEGAQRAIRYIRVIRTLRCPNQPWENVFGRYHHGGVGPNRGCWADNLARRQVREMNLGVRIWARMVPGAVRLASN